MNCGMPWGRRDMPLLLVMAILLCLPPEAALARAGVVPEVAAAAGVLGVLVVAGQWILAILLLPVGIYFTIRLQRKLKAKKREAVAVLTRIEDTDPVWSEEHLLERVRELYEMIQDAWSQGDIEAVRPLFTEAGFKRFERQMERLKRRNLRNIIDDIVLKEVSVVEVKDYKDDSRDSIWVLFEGSMLDYYENDADGKVVDGDKKGSKSFSDLWRFKRGPDGDWIVDEMQPECEEEMVEKLHSFTELDQPIGEGRPEAHASGKAGTTSRPAAGAK